MELVRYYSKDSLRVRIYAIVKEIQKGYSLFLSNSEHTYWLYDGLK
jgi:hypothetical protein